ncbi:hypothetical protein ACIOJD_14765 [Streptomyces sp. NPDC088116]|uniref:hypothetical protein n=1 Tax=Streptomyces sp. NPDC088116 TaxID=3365825 RepID=UPI0037FEAA2E
MTARAIDRLRAEASRDDYASMTQLAQALYETGLVPQQVLRECYGVRFPKEIFVVVEGGLWRLRLRARFTNQPWQLAIPPARGGPATTLNSMIDTELRLLAEDPDLMPLFRVPAVAIGKEDQVVCYRLSELRAGRSTVFGLFQSSHAGSALDCGESLLKFLYSEHARAVRRLEGEQRAPSSWGAGSVDDEEVEQANESLERVRELQRQAADRQGD